MSAAPHHTGPHISRRDLMHRPLVVALGVIILAIALVLLSYPLWHNAFGFPAGDAWALSVGLIAYAALMIGIFGLIAFALDRESHRIW
jgi:hypothetical protein